MNEVSCFAGDFHTPGSINNRVDMIMREVESLDLLIYLIIILLEK